MIRLACPGCGEEVRVLGGSAFHECPRRNNRQTEFKPVPPAEGEA